MRILFDNCTPAGLLPLLSQRGWTDITLSKTLGWAEYSNGQLLDVAAMQGFEVIITIDRDFTDMNTIGKKRLESLRVGVIIIFYNNEDCPETYLEETVETLQKIRSGQVVIIQNKAL